MDVQALTEAIETYIRPATFPVGIKMLAPGQALPPKTRTPADMGSRFATCQTINIVRRYGWSIGLTADHHSCPLGLVALGFKPNVGYLQEGNACIGMYTESLEAGARTEAAVPKFELGRYAALYASPLRNHPFTPPDVVIVFGNSAQVMRLVQAALFKRGGYLHSAFSGRLDCADLVVQTMQTDECQVVLPCTGDRMFGQTHDDEMAFSIPASKLDEVMAGLQSTHKSGIRYPVPSFMNYTAKFPPQYEAVWDMWDEKDPARRPEGA
jgi:uncharacterized protein (DUF169 family)